MQLKKKKALANYEYKKGLDSYLKACEEDSAIFITDHAIVRYLERVKGLSLTKGTNDHETVSIYLSETNTRAYILREKVLSKKQMRACLLSGKPHFKIGNYRYVFVDFNLITIINRSDTDCSSEEHY